MSEPRPSEAYDVRAPDGVETRFGIRLLNYDEASSSVAMSMPVVGMTNPMTNESTVAPLALLADDAGSMAAFSCRRGRWPVTSELVLVVVPDAAMAEANVDAPVFVHGNVMSSFGSNALATCRFTHEDRLIASAFVRSVYVSSEAVLDREPRETLVKTRDTELGTLLAVRAQSPEGSDQVLQQLSDPMLWNPMGKVHGGVSATALELVAHAAIADRRKDVRFRTGSLQVNFLSPLGAGPGCRYVGAARRVGRTVAFADAWAEGDDGNVAVVARLTAYGDPAD